MKKIILTVLITIGLCSPFFVFAQNNYQYVALKGGLSIREKADVNAKVIDKIPYGTKVSLLPPEENIVSIVTEGLTGWWRKVKYNNKTGYIIDSYLFPHPPPKTTVKTVKDYLNQISPVFGSKLVVKNGSMNNIEEGGYQTTKQLYKNGGEWHEYGGHEYYSNTYFIPDFNLPQAFQLLRMIPEFKSAIGDKDEFITENKTFAKGDIEYTVTVDKEQLGKEWWIKKITIEFIEGGNYLFELHQVDNQAVVFFSSGL
jgi:hypothetical protein